MKKWEKNRKRSVELKKKREKRELLSRRKKKLNRVFKEFVNNPNKNSLPYKKKGKGRVRPKITAPKNISLYDKDDHNKLAEFLGKIRKATLLGEEKVTLDFSLTEFNEASGTLLLLSEVDRIQRIKGSKDFIRSRLPKSNRVSQVFQQIGLSKKLGIGKEVKITRSDVDFWENITDIKVDGSNAEPFFKKMELEFEGEARARLFRSFTEAINNSVEHAYIFSRGDGGKLGEKRWWAFSGIKNRKFVIVVCDLGIGISRSLPKKWPNFVDYIFQNLKLPSRDWAYIKASIELGRTRTEEPFKGYGMTDILEATKEFGEGTTIIFSNKGIYYYNAEEGKEDTFEREGSIYGTIIEWIIPIGPQEGHTNGD